MAEGFELGGGATGELKLGTAANDTTLAPPPTVSGGTPPTGEQLAARKGSIDFALQRARSGYGDPASIARARANLDQALARSGYSEAKQAALRQQFNDLIEPSPAATMKKTVGSDITEGDMTAGSGLMDKRLGATTDRDVSAPMAMAGGVKGGGGKSPFMVVGGTAQRARSSSSGGKATPMTPSKSVKTGTGEFPGKPPTASKPATKPAASLERDLVTMPEEDATYVASLSAPTREWLAKLRPDAVRRLAGARIRSPFALRQLVEKIGPSTSLQKIEQAIAKAEHHQNILQKAHEATESGDWTKISGTERSSIGRHIGYELEEITRVAASGGRAKAILNYEMINKQRIAKLREGRGRVLITQGRLKGGDLRFDIAEIDFDQKTGELIDLAPRPDPVHQKGTLTYAKEMQKLLPDITFKTSESYYVGAEGQVLEELEEVVLKK
jgi:hypothetical protein